MTLFGSAVVYFIFHSFLKMFSIFLLCLLLGQGALSYDHHIHNASDLIAFSNKVNSGSTYSVITIFLDADIDFSDGLSEQFEPIGKDSSKYFRGTFNGQGHTISNLVMNSSSEDVGLFGFSRGATIRNVVMDSSCSVVSSYSNTSSVYVGGIVGYCSDCTIENTVSMASVSFTGNTSWSLHLGGIAGLSASNNEAIVKNCANYGSVALSGTAGSPANIGGIVGYSWGSSGKTYIQNCLNYGTIKCNGTTIRSLYIGGIIGQAYGTNNLENCVSGGKITSNKQGYIGSVVGYVSPTTNISHCYWTSDVGNYKACGDGSPTIDNETKDFSLSTTTVNSLNSYNSSWSKWLLNTNNKSATFKVNSGKGFSLSSQLILLPNFAESENHNFSGWFEDEECTKEFTGSSVEADTILYGRLGMHCDL